MKTENWLPPLNIGYPLNTTDDDLFFFPGEIRKYCLSIAFSCLISESDIVRYQITSFGNPARFTLIGKVNVQGRIYPSKHFCYLYRIIQANNTLSAEVKPDGSFSRKFPPAVIRWILSDGKDYG